MQHTGGDQGFFFCSSTGTCHILEEKKSFCISAVKVKLHLSFYEHEHSCKPELFNTCLPTEFV